MEEEIYKIFGKVFITDKPKVTHAEMLEVSLPLGLYVPEELCYDWLFCYLAMQKWNPNSTFYQRWKDMKDKNRFELFIDQIIHYTSTYGTDFQGETWLPERTQLPDFPFKELKVVEGITREELIDKVLNLAYANVAMKTETIDFLLSFNKWLTLDIAKVKNRELKLRLIPDGYKFTDGQECLLWILWKTNSITMLVKNKNVLASIKPPVELKKTLENNKEVLASVFRRNKDVFMRFKKAPELRNVVNRIRKLSDKHHKPMKKSPWLMLDMLTSQQRAKLFKQASVFKLVQMCNALANPTGYYVIRNGKAYFRAERQRPMNARTRLIIIGEIVNTIAQKVYQKFADNPTAPTVVALPKGIELAMPMSEKSFIGDIPLGSYVECSEKNTMVGIYWKNEWGARDLDLHCKLTDDTEIGWNRMYRHDDDVLFSGDMTNADPEATEVLWFKQKPMDSIVSVLKYNGNSNYGYDVFIAQEDATKFDRNYMVDPRNVVYRCHLDLSNCRDKTIGFFQDGKFVFHSCQIGNNIVPGKIRTSILEHLTSCHYLTVREVLEIAGIDVSDDADVKLCSKGDLLDFFS